MKIIESIGTVLTFLLLTSGFIYLVGPTVLSNLGISNPVKILSGSHSAEIQSQQQTQAYVERRMPVINLNSDARPESQASQQITNDQVEFGLMYATGEGRPQDFSKAVQFFRVAAEKGNATAQYLLGSAYSRGDGVLKDDSEADKWFYKAALQGDAAAQGQLGRAYSLGIGVPKNSIEAAKYYKAGASNGDQWSMYGMGYLYSMGQGVPKNYQEATKWCLKAIKNNEDKGITQDAEQLIRLNQLELSDQRQERRLQAESVQYEQEYEQSSANMATSLAILQAQANVRANTPTLPPPSPMPVQTRCYAFGNGMMNCTSQ